MVIGSNTASFHSVSRTFCARNGNPSFSAIALTRLGPEREFPMTGHGVGLQKRHAVDHVLALGEHGGVAVLPGVAAVEEQCAVATLGAN